MKNDLKKTIKKKFKYKIMLLSLLNISASTFQSIAVAATHNALYSDDSNGIINLQKGDVIEATTGKSSNLYGITINRNGSATLGGDINISVSDPVNTGGAYYAFGGIYVREQGKLISADNLSINLSNGTGNVRLNGFVLEDKATAHLGKNNIITIKSSSDTNNSSIYGIYTSDSGSLFKSEGMHIDVLGSGSEQVAGIAVKGGGKVDLGIGSSNSIIAESNSGNAYGVSVDGLNNNGSSKFTEFYADNLKVIVNSGSAASSNATGFSIQGNTIVDLGTDSYIQTSGDISHGVFISAYNHISADLKAVGLTIKTDGKGSNGIEARENSFVDIGSGSHIITKQSGSLVATTQNGSKPARIDFLGSESNRNTILSGGSYGASAQFGGATVNLAYTDIMNNGAGSAGIWAMKGGEIVGDNLTIYGAEKSAYGVHAQANSSINLTGNTAIYMANPMGIAISTKHTDGYAASLINATGKMDINGGISSGGGIINIDMDSGSQWNGWASSNNNGVLNVALKNSIWNMNADSNIDKLILDNSTVDISNVISKTKNAWTGSLLTLDTLSGNGHFIMRTDIVGDGISNANDKLIVTGSSAGDYQLTVVNSGSLATKGNEVLTLVETRDGLATFSSTHQTELGGYLYDVRKSGTNWELYASGAVVSPPAVIPPTTTPPPTITTTADAGANFLNVGYLMNYAETQTLLQRMGDLRQNGEHGDMWLRGFSGKFDSFSGGKLSQFDMAYSGMQIGADKRISDEIPLFVGVFMGQTNSSPDYNSGDGTTKSSNAGIYGSYMAVNGFYMDAVAKYSHVKNSFNVRDSQDNPVSGNGNSDAVSLSLEAGQKFNFGEQNNGFYVEPQLQLTYGHQDATRIKASNGLRVDLGSYESLTGRASALLGYELNQGDSKVNIYLKTGIVREFKGDVDYQLNGSTENHTFKDNWWNNSVGVSTQINKQHTLYLDLDSSTGNKFNQRQINGGYRFNF
ncbi:autotransporter outer membrane beta-barrel domain-containing protein [Morganella morganii]|uniref:autotransporter outer membrane beta-barrel domain-containing protein n=1 Tax=Morganella morganii TaxID=582 RepID=UPI003EBA1925